MAMLRFVDDGSGYDLVDANLLAVRLLGVTGAALEGPAFADGLHSDDAVVLHEALGAASAEPSDEVLVRWGSVPPVTFLRARFHRQDDGSVLVALHDATDLYRLDVLACAHGSGIFFADADGIVSWMSPLSAITMGLTPDMMIGLHNGAYVHPDDQEILRRGTAELLAHPSVEFTNVYRVCHPLIPDTWWPMRIVSVYLPDEPAVGAIVNRTEMFVEPGDEGPGDTGQINMAEVMPSGLIAATEGRITFRNSLVRQMLGSTIESSDAEAWVAALRPEHRDPARQAIQAAADGRRETVVAAVDHADQAPTWLRIEASPTTDAAGRVVGYVATFLDVTTETEARQELEQSREQLWVQANHDALTGLANRMQFQDRLEQALARKRRDGHPLAVLFCDLDLFKRVNDEQGHHAGDAVLVEIARRLRASTRETDTVCRIGGDEFVVICEAFDDVSGVERLAARLISAVGAPIEGPHVSARIQVSVGIAIAGPASALDDLLSQADGAMYVAKESGRGRYVVAGQARAAAGRTSSTTRRR
jgi:diguanylate cyclase (GGDEF)-like protein/PAS domain S-box-containing protein